MYTFLSINILIARTNNLPLSYVVTYIYLGIKFHSNNILTISRQREGSTSLEKSSGV